MSFLGKIIIMRIEQERFTQLAIEMTSLPIIGLRLEQQKRSETSQVIQTIRNGREQIQHIQRRHEDKNIERENERLREENWKSKNQDISKMESHE